MNKRITINTCGWSEIKRTEWPPLSAKLRSMPGPRFCYYLYLSLPLNSTYDCHSFIQVLDNNNNSQTAFLCAIHSSADTQHEFVIICLWAWVYVNVILWVHHGALITTSLRRRMSVIHNWIFLLPLFGVLFMSNRFLSPWLAWWYWLGWWHAGWLAV